MKTTSLSTTSKGVTRPAAVPTSRIFWRPRQDLSMQDWIAQGRRLGMAGRNVGWWIGDWLRFGNAAYGERYSRAAQVTGYDAQTLMNMVYVASQVAVDRRRAGLSWSHHAEVAALPAEQQDTWLARAEQDRLSVRDLREAIRRERRRGRMKDAAEGADPNSNDDHDAVRCPGCGHVFAVAAPMGVAA